MEAIAKAMLILASFTLLHEVLRLVYTYAANACELSHCGCGRPPSWLVQGVRLVDFFFEWPIRNFDLSGLIWGSAATVLCLWIGKRRKAKRLTREVNAGVQSGIWPPAPKRL